MDVTSPDTMLVILGFAMIATFMTLIMTKRMTPLVALILVPTVFGLFAGAGLGLGDMILEAIGNMAPTAALLMFAILYFGIMIDVGLFDPLIRAITRLLGNDPAKVVLGTAILSGAVSLDGDGSTTFIITTAAMLPIYLRLGMSPVILTCVAGLTNGTLNIVPWGGPTARAAAALSLDPADIFVPMVPSLVAGLALTLGFAWMLGLRERKRLGGVLDLDRLSRGGSAVLDSPDLGSSGSTGAGPAGSGPAGTGPAGTDPVGTAVMVEEKLDLTSVEDSMAGTVLDPNRATLRPKLLWFNLALTVAIMVLLVLDLLPLSIVFMIGSAIALLVNFPKLKEQGEAIVSQSSSIVAVVSMVMAAAVLVGVLDGTGMVLAMADWLTAIIPEAMGPYLAVITGVLSLPLTFLMSNDAFYFGMLPVLAESAANFGITPAEMARASVVGQPVHMQSPLVPAILLLVSLANVNLGDHHKKVLWRAAAVSLVMLVVGVLLGSIPFAAS